MKKFEYRKFLNPVLVPQPLSQSRNEGEMKENLAKNFSISYEILIIKMCSWGVSLPRKHSAPLRVFASTSLNTFNDENEQVLLRCFLHTKLHLIFPFVKKSFQQDFPKKLFSSQDFLSNSKSFCV